MFSCKGTRKDGKSCKNQVKEGEYFCWLHKPDDQEEWRVFYKRIAEATPEEKTDIVLELIEEHPKHLLELPERDGVVADLREIDLSKDNLEGRMSQKDANIPSWWDVEQMRPNLQGANLKKASLWRANLRGIHLGQANLQEAELGLANLEGADLWRTDLRGADLRGANLREASLFDANLPKAILWNANLQEADLRGADLQEANLMNAKLHSANLISSNLTHVYISEAWLEQTKLQFQQIENGIGEERDKNYAGAKQGYLLLKRNFEKLGDYDAARRTYQKERRMEKLTPLQIARDAIRERKWITAIGNLLKFAIGSIVERLGKR